MSGAEPMSLSMVIQMQPLSLPGRPGEVWDGDLEVFAEQFTRYVVHNLGKFAEPRDADMFVVVVAKRGDRTGGHEYRDGAYVKSGAAATEDDSEETP